MPQSTVIVVNRSAGAGPREIDALSRRLADALGRRGTRARSITLDPDGRWQRDVENAIDHGASSVHVLGGDGTMLTVASRLLNRPVPLGIVPLGTANLLARDLGLPAKPKQAVDWLGAATSDDRRAIDVGRVNGAHFLCASMLGVATPLARVREKRRGSGLRDLAPRLARRALWLMPRYPYRHVRLHLDDEVVELKTRAMVISNNPLTGRTGTVFERQRLDSGRLGVYGIKEGPLWELPRLALRLFDGTWASDHRIFAHDAQHVIVRTEQNRRITVLNDGEFLHLHTPLSYDIRPKALTVIAPATEPLPAAARPRVWP